MRGMGLVSALSMIGLLPLALGQGCPQPTPPASFNAADLTEAENDALDAAVEAAGALTQASSTTQNAAGAGETSGAPTPGEFSFGTCPIVSGQVNGDGELAASLTIDFGTGCTPFEGYACSGNATGTFTRSTRSISIGFNSIHCNDDTLTGTVAVTYDLSSAGVGLAGTWDLAWQSGDDTIAAGGNGTCSYDRAAHATTISHFAGQLSDGPAAYAAVLNDVLVSYQTNGNLIPSGGTATVSSPAIRSLSMRFNANSPATGDVEVSINGSPYFPANLYAF